MGYSPHKPVGVRSCEVVIMHPERLLVRTQLRFRSLWSSISYGGSMLKTAQLDVHVFPHNSVPQVKGFSGFKDFLHPCDSRCILFLVPRSTGVFGAIRESQLDAQVAGARTARSSLEAQEDGQELRGLAAAEAEVLEHLLVQGASVPSPCLRTNGPLVVGFFLASFFPDPKKRRGTRWAQEIVRFSKKGSTML